MCVQSSCAILSCKAKAKASPRAKIVASRHREGRGCRQAVTNRAAHASLLAYHCQNYCAGHALSPLEMPSDASFMTCRHGKGWECRLAGVTHCPRGSGCSTPARGSGSRGSRVAAGLPLPQLLRRPRMVPPRDAARRLVDGLRARDWGVMSVGRCNTMPAARGAQDVTPVDGS